MEIGALVNAVVRAAAPGSRDGERLALSLKLVVNVLRDHGVRPDLVRELQSLAARNDRIVMVQPAGGAARLEVAGQHFVLSDSLRRALLAAGQTPSPGAGARAAAQNLASSTASAGAATGALGTPGAGADALLRAAIALLPHAVAQGPDAARQRRRSADPGRAIALDLPALLAEDEPDAAQAGQQLQAAVRRSPLFLEAQAARATASGRALDGAGAAANLPPAERAALQLDALRRDAVAFAFNAWDRQPVQLDIAAEREIGDGAGDAATMAPVFTATLRMQLPQLGAVAVSLRLLHDTVAATIESNDPVRMQSALPQLAEQLRSRGLQPVALAAIAPEDEPAA